MTGIGLALVAIGLGDLASGGLSGQPAGRVRTTMGWGLVVATAVTGAWLVRLDRPLLFVVLVSAGAAGWLFSRGWASSGALGAWMALGTLGASLTLLLFLSGQWVASFPHGFHDWIGGLPFRHASEAGLDRLFLTAGVLVALTASANGLVRAVLAVAGSELASSEERLRGGRFIGIVERLLIFGLAVAGEPAAAALIASAKSILRFPELSRVAGSSARVEDGTGEEEPGRMVADVDIVTEYFLLGSLVSWLAALAPVPLLLH